MSLIALLSPDLSYEFNSTCSFNLLYVLIKGFFN